MSESSIARKLWLPAVILLVAGAAVVFALSQSPDRPDLDPAESERREASTRPAGGEAAPLPDGPDEETRGATGEEESAPTGAARVVEAPEGVEPPEGEGIVGILVDAEGQPVSRARVRVSRNIADLARGGGHELRGMVRLDATGSGFSFGREAGITDRQGRFAIPKVGKEGKYDVSFTHGDHPAHRVEDVSWTPASRVDLGVVRIPAGGTIFGFVRDESGAPVSGARVSRTQGHSGGGTPRAFAFKAVSIAVEGNSGNVISVGGPHGEMTDAEGYFEMTRVPPGTYDLRAKGSGTAEALREKLVVGEGARTGPVQLTIGKGLEISGTVVDERGQPVPKATIMSFRSGSNQSTRADAQGRFKLTGLSPGKVRLNVFGGRGMFGGVQSSQEVEAGSSGVRLVLTKGLTLAGRIVSAATGAPITNARISIVSGDEGNLRRRMTMAMGGSFQFTSLEPGDYRLEIQARGFRTVEEGPYTLVEGRSIEDLVVRLQPE